MPDDDRPFWARHQLRMAPQTKIVVTYDEELFIDGAVGLMTRWAAFTKGLMFVHAGSGLFSVALITDLVLPPEEDPFGQESVFSVHVMATDAAHVPFSEGMVVLEVKLGLFFQMALITGCRILPRIDDGFSASSSPRHVKTAGAVAAFAPRAFRRFLAGRQAFVMRIPVEIRPDVRVAGFARIASHVARRERRRALALRHQGQGGGQQQVGDEAGHTPNDTEPRRLGSRNRIRIYVG